jgi:hypothetical protein
MKMVQMKNILFTAVLLSLFLTSFEISAKKHKLPPLRHVGLIIENSTLKTTFSYRDIFTKTVKQKLMSGLSNSIILHISMENQKGKQFAYFTRTVNITYNLWDDNFSVVVVCNHKKRRSKVKTIKEAMDIAAIAWRIPIAPKKYRGVFRLKVMAEANPVSKEMVRNIQKWLTRPTPSDYASNGSTTNYFGSFVGYFVDRKIGQADKTVIFVSQWFRL